MKTELFSYFTKDKKQITFCLATFKDFNDQLVGTLGIDLGQAYVHIPINGIEGAENLSNLLIKVAETISSTSKAEEKSEPSLLEAQSLEKVS